VADGDPTDGEAAGIAEGVVAAEGEVAELEQAVRAMIASDRQIPDLLIAVTTFPLSRIRRLYFAVTTAADLRAVGYDT
jgi:hypothetical protein